MGYRSLTSIKGFPNHLLDGLFEMPSLLVIVVIVAVFVVKIILEDMNNDFFEQYNGEPVVIPFSVYLNNGFIYAFNYTLTRIENINAKYLSIVGNMEITRSIGNPDSFMNAYSPRIKDDVVLKYDIANSILKFTRNPKGLVIRPALNVNGTNNTRWNELVQYATDYLKGLHRIQRP